MTMTGMVLVVVIRVTLIITTRIGTTAHGS